MMVEPKTSIEWPLTAEHESSQGPFLYAGSCVQQGLFFHVCGKPHSSERRSACVLSSALIKAR